MLEGYTFQSANAFMRDGLTETASETKNSSYPSSLGLSAQKDCPSSPSPTSLEGHTGRSERRNLMEIRYSLFRNNAGGRRVQSGRKVIEPPFNMIGELRSRIYKTPPRAWIRNRGEDLFSSVLEMSEPTMSNM